METSLIEKKKKSVAGDVTEMYLLSEHEDPSLFTFFLKTWGFAPVIPVPQTPRLAG